MSLINRMLQDLEAREDPAAGPTPPPVYRDLRPVGGRTRADPNAWRLPAALLAVVAVGVAAYVAVDRVGLVLVPPTASAAKPPAGTPTARMAVNRTKAQPTARPTPVSDPSRSPIPEISEPKPVVTAAAEPISPPPKPKPTPAKRQPKVVAPPPPKPSPAHSQKKAQVGIVKAKEPTPAPVHKGEREPVTAKAPAPSLRRTTANDTEHLAVVDKQVRPLTAEEKAEANFRRAVRLLDQGRADDAMASLRLTLRAQPNHVKARELAAGLALQGGHWREAQRLLEEGLRQVPSHYPFARMLARVYVDHGAEAKALAVMESAAPEGSDDAEFSALLALLYQRAGRHADAVKIYERSLQLRPDDARTWLGFAISLEGMQKWDAAKNAYRRAKQIGGLTPRLIQYADQRLAALGTH